MRAERRAITPGRFRSFPTTTIKEAMIQSIYLGRVDYGEGLRVQAEIAGLVAQGRIPNALLLLEHPPVLTLGRNGHRSNILVSNELLASRGITVHEISRGGDVTYHGPGQLVGYPIFNLRAMSKPGGGRQGPVSFVHGMEEAFIRLCGEFGLRAGRIAGLTGVWCPPASGPADKSDDPMAGASSRSEAKICAIGIHVSHGITSHGFAFNVTTDLRNFELIIPCGIPDHTATSLEKEVLRQKVRNAAPLPTLEAIAHQVARQFGQVFGEPVQEFESLEALRAAAARQFPTEDTPLQTPREVERLRGGADPPLRA